jgi:hypothetical protein
MSITIALTEDQRSLLQVSLEIARDKFNVYATSEGVGVRLADQFKKQAGQAEELLMRVANAENVIIEEARD